MDRFDPIQDCPLTRNYFKFSASFEVTSHQLRIQQGSVHPDPALISSLHILLCMCRHMGSRFEMPAASFGVFGILMLLIWVPIYDLLVMRWFKRATGNERGITSLQRIGTGLFIAILAMVTAAIVEVKRRNAAHQHGLLDKPDIMIPVSAFWLVPQHCLFGLAESFVFIGELEFFYDQSPESMRSTGTALFWSTFAFGNYVSTVLVTLISKKTNWLENNLNRAHLDYFYWFLAALSAVNLIFFLLSATWFRYRNEGLEPDLISTSDEFCTNRSLQKIHRFSRILHSIIQTFLLAYAQASPASTAHNLNTRLINNVDRHHIC